MDEGKEKMKKETVKEECETCMKSEGEACANSRSMKQWAMDRCGCGCGV